MKQNTGGRDMGKIKFVREYDFYGSKMFNVLYCDEKGKITRCNTYDSDKLTKTAELFIANAKQHIEQTDRIHGKEIIHK